MPSCRSVSLMAVSHAELDAVDRKILRLLQEDARRSYRQLGEMVDLRAPSVHARVQRLEKDGFIRGYHADIDPERVGRSMTAYVSIGLEGGRKGACVVHLKFLQGRYWGSCNGLRFESG